MSAEIPESMRTELAAWNEGAGIDLETWVGCVGSFALAVGYSTIFWPEFIEFEGFVLRKGFSEESLRGFIQQSGGNRSAVERAMNHWHLSSLQHSNCEDLSKDKLLKIGNSLKEIHEAKLRWQFPERSTRVEFFVPDDLHDLDEYQISFWQQPVSDLAEGE